MGANQMSQSSNNMGGGGGGGDPLVNDLYTLVDDFLPIPVEAQGSNHNQQHVNKVRGGGGVG